MRTINNLLKFSELKVLYQYLYMSEDSYIDIKNSIDVTLRLRMSDNMAILCQNMSFPDLPPSNSSKTDDELKMLYRQYLDFQHTGIIPNNQLGKIRDSIIEQVGSGVWHVLMMMYLLEEIGNRWTAMNT